MKGQTIEVIGSRSSKDPFFSTRYKYEHNAKTKIELTPSEIDSGDVLKASITNAQAIGITAILGVKNLTWEDLAGVGIRREDVSGKVDYKKKDQSGQSSAPQPKDPNAPVSDKQKSAIHAILGQLGIKDDKEKHRKVSEAIFGDPEVLKSFSELTMKDAGHVIETLGKEAK